MRCLWVCVHLQGHAHANEGNRALLRGTGRHTHGAGLASWQAATSSQSRQLLQDNTALSLTAQQLLHSKQAIAHQSDVSAGAVFVLTILMASATCLGAVPFFFVGTLSTRWSALANAIACGVMLAASFDLVHEGEPYGGGLVIVGIMIGGSPSSHADIASEAL